MPLELIRRDVTGLPCPSLPPGSGPAELLDLYLREFSKATRRLRRSVTLPLLGLDSGVPPEVSLKTGVRAASIYLREHEMSIVLAVPESFAPGGQVYGELALYISQRYTGFDGSVFDANFSRMPPDSAPFRPIDYPAAPTATMEFSVPAAARGPSAAPGARQKPSASPVPESLEKMLKNTDAGFSETLLRLIDASGKKDSQVYKRANIDRKLFSKIRSNPSYRPSKSTALALAFALELDLEGARDLIGRAGYTLTHANRGDIIVEYFITHRNYDIYQLNETLFAFDQPILGG